MCGIAAIFDPGSRADQKLTERLAESLRHRGPDGFAVEELGAATLVHARLAIIDVEGGDQPFVSEDGRFTAIVNGEIYNHLNLRRELEAAGHRFSTHSDCEVVLHGFEQWGLEVLRRINGMFGIAIWDR